MVYGRDDFFFFCYSKLITHLRHCFEIKIFLPLVLIIVGQGRSYYAYLRCFMMYYNIFFFVQKKSKRKKKRFIMSINIYLEKYNFTNIWKCFCTHLWNLFVNKNHLFHFLLLRQCNDNPDNNNKKRKKKLLWLRVCTVQ